MASPYHIPLQLIGAYPKGYPRATKQTIGPLSGYDIASVKPTQSQYWIRVELWNGSVFFCARIEQVPQNDA